MRESRPLVGLAILAASLAWMLALPAHAAWHPDGVTVKATSASIPLVSGCSSGDFDSFVAWQEESAPGQGVVRVQHLTANGGLDPAWPAAGAVASDVVAARARMGAVPDRLGGIYVWWIEGDQLYLNRVISPGVVAAGWPARGRLLGTVAAASPAPSVIEDGAHGIYAAWSASTVVMAAHLGPDNAGAGGAPSVSFALSPPGQSDVLWPQLALAGDGGVFLAWAIGDPGEWRLMRYASDAADAPGWPGEGLLLGAFPRELLGEATQSSLLAMDADGRGGVFVLTGNPTSAENRTFEPRLYRRQGDGQTAADWPDQGRAAPGGHPYFVGDHPDGSLRTFSDGRDGAYAGLPVYPYDAPVILTTLPISAAGQWGPSSSGTALGLEQVRTSAGSVFTAHFNADGPAHPFDDPAYLAVSPGFFESHHEPSQPWYGDIGLAPSGPHGAIFFWSQRHQRFGLFARRISTQGEVTGVPAVAAARLGTVRFVAGRGVVARTESAGSARLELFDLGGRRIAWVGVEAPGAAELTIPGTAGLASGLYFATLRSGAANERAKVVVQR